MLSYRSYKYVSKLLSIHSVSSKTHGIGFPETGSSTFFISLAVGRGHETSSVVLSHHAPSSLVTWRHTSTHISRYPSNSFGTRPHPQTVCYEQPHPTLDLFPESQTCFLRIRSPIRKGKYHLTYSHRQTGIYYTFYSNIR